MDPIEEEKSIKKQRKRTEDQNFMPSKMQINSLSQSSSQLSPSHKRMYNTIHNNHENSRQSGMFYNVLSVYRAKQRMECKQIWKMGKLRVILLKTHIKFSNDLNPILEDSKTPNSHKRKPDGSNSSATKYDIIENPIFKPIIRRKVKNNVQKISQPSLKILDVNSADIFTINSNESTHKHWNTPVSKITINKLSMQRYKVNI